MARRVGCRYARDSRAADHHDYLQTGAKGQGRIRIEVGEVERLMAAMRVRPRPIRQRRPPTKRHHYPGITVVLGDPND